MIIWIASFPRSGNTFLRVLLNSVFELHTFSLYNDEKDIGNDDTTTNVVGHENLPQAFDFESARNDQKIYLIKTHELLDDRVSEEDKIFYLIRDGREASLSFVKYLNDYYQRRLNLKDIIMGNTLAGTWGDHVESWTGKPRVNLLVIYFEKLITDPGGFVEKISEFINVTPLHENIPGFSELNEINPKFFRSGRKDSWKNSFSKDEHYLFWLKNYNQMLSHGYKDEKPEIIKDESLLLIFHSLSKENSYLTTEISKLSHRIDFLKNNTNQSLLEIKSHFEINRKIISQVNSKTDTLFESINQLISTIENKLDRSQIILKLNLIILGFVVLGFLIDFFFI